jgi:hypothetical protein
MCSTSYQELSYLIRDIFLKGMPRDAHNWREEELNEEER